MLLCKGMGKAAGRQYPFYGIFEMKQIMTTLERLKRYLNREKLYQIIFESDTYAGRLFDTVLIVAILLSVLAAIIESLPFVSEGWRLALQVFEYVSTFFFTVEYILRIYVSDKPRSYIFSFFGIVDLLATLPLYLAFFFPSVRYVLIIRAFRLIRVFRVFKLFNYWTEGNLLLRSVQKSMRKIFVFFLFVLILVISIGTIMYMVEGDHPESGFTDIPTSIYWAIVTLTTVGYGDITPLTAVGRFISGVVMLLGYTIIAVPTGIVSVTLMDEQKKAGGTCPNCGRPLDFDARYCKYCGTKVMSEEPNEESRQN